MEQRKSSGEKLHFGVGLQVQSILVIYQSSETWITHLCLTSLAELHIFNVIQNKKNGFLQRIDPFKVLLDCSAASHGGSEFGGLKRTTHQLTLGYLQWAGEVNFPRNEKGLPVHYPGGMPERLKHEIILENFCRTWRYFKGNRGSCLA